MHLKASLAVMSVLVFATVAVAKDGVSNPTVKARMDAMSAIGASTKILGGMAGGRIAFDATAANAAASTIAEKAALVPALFEPREADPVSEAKAEIWTNWDDFVAKSDALLAAARVVETATTKEALAAVVGDLGGACKACHSDYRM